MDVDRQEKETGKSEAARARGLNGWLWHGYLKRYLWIIVIAVIFMTFEGAMLGALSYLIKPMFDNVLVAKNGDAIIWVGIAILAVFSTRALASFAHRVLMAIVGQRMMARLQADLVSHMLTLDGRFYQDYSPGTLIERTRGDTLVASTVWATVFSAFARDLVSLVALLGVAVMIDWRWALIAAAGAPLLAIPITVLQRMVRRTTTAAREAAARVSTRLDEIFHGANAIKFSGSEDREAKRFSQEIDSFVSSQLKSESGQAAIPALIDFVAGLGFFGVLLYGGSQIIEGEKTVGEFMSFFTAMALVFEPLRRLGNVSGVWQAARASFERIHAIFLERPTIVSPKAPVSLAKPAQRSDIVLTDVVFAYGDDPVLRGVNFTAKAGETTALVGASGAGKSTIFNLLTRLADPDSGSIEIGGTGTKDIALGALRNLFSVVSQDALLFDESIRDNILMGAKVDDTVLSTAMHAAHVEDFVKKLESGIETPAGPRGSALSGGQRQRVAIARAILRDRPILLLDEATSALDAQSEKIVQDALEKLSKGRTTLVIAHRLSTIRNAHKIVVMDQGRVVDQGTHDELLARGGLYADLYRLQYSDGKTLSDSRGIAARDARREGTAQGATDSAHLGAASRLFGSVRDLFSRTPR